MFEILACFKIPDKVETCHLVVEHVPGVGAVGEEFAGADSLIS